MPQGGPSRQPRHSRAKDSMGPGSAHDMDFCKAFRREYY